MLAFLSKVFAIIIEGRITHYQWIMGQINPAQFGFTKGRRTLDAVFVLDTLMAQARAEKRPLYVAFIDFQKAYDLVDRDCLFYKMLNYGIDGPILNTIVGMYRAVRSILRMGTMGHEVSEVIEQLVGLRQGCVLSPCLFTLYIADLPAWLEAAGTRGVLVMILGHGCYYMLMMRYWWQTRRKTSKKCLEP